MTVYAYLRVSSEDQSCENQKQGILNFCKYKGFELDKEVRDEGISGKVSYRNRKLGTLVKKLKQNDILVVSELSRLSRSMTDTFELIKLLNDKQIDVYCVKENLKIGSDALGLMIVSVFAFASEIERQRISERTKECLKRLKNDGKHLGRPFGFSYCFLNEFKEDIVKDIENGLNKTQIAKKYKCSWSTVDRFFKENNLKIIRSKNDSK